MIRAAFLDFQLEWGCSTVGPPTRVTALAAVTPGLCKTCWFVVSGVVLVRSWEWNEDKFPSGMKDGKRVEMIFNHLSILITCTAVRGTSRYNTVQPQARRWHSPPIDIFHCTSACSETYWGGKKKEIPEPLGVAPINSKVATGWSCFYGGAAFLFISLFFFSFSISHLPPPLGIQVYRWRLRFYPNRIAILLSLVAQFPRLLSVLICIFTLSQRQTTAHPDFIHHACQQEDRTL